jgi:hypothetical protein
MRRSLFPLLLLALATNAIAAETTIVYDFWSDSARSQALPNQGHHQTMSTIDGPNFRNVASLSNAVELSDDDGRTTYFGAFHTTPQTPLGPDVAKPGDPPSNLGPISGGIQDEQLKVGPPSPGPTLFGLATHVYTVDYRYTVAIRIAGVPIRHTVNEEHYTITAADTDVSSAALRVAFSRGYGHAISKHAEAFVGLPLHIESTRQSDGRTITVYVDATKVER